MFLSNNFVIYTISGLVLTDFSEYGSYLFLLLCRPGNFLLNARIMNSILLGVGYFCTSINIFEFSSASPLIYCKTV